MKTDVAPNTHGVVHTDDGHRRLGALRTLPARASAGNSESAPVVPEP